MRNAPWSAGQVESSVMWRWRWRTFWLTLPVSLAALLVIGTSLVVIGMLLSLLNWGMAVPGFGRITHFLLDVPFEPKAERRGDILLSTLAITAAMNIATLATLASLLAA